MISTYVHVDTCTCTVLYNDTNALMHAWCYHLCIIRTAYKHSHVSYAFTFICKVLLSIL